ncbi:MAG: serine hydrolase [Endomicrobiia bacterium]
MKIKKFLILILILIFPAVAYFSIIEGYKYHQYLQKKKVYKTLSFEIAKNASEFYGKVGIYIKDLKTGITVGYNEDELFPSASLVKTPLMGVAFKAQKEGLLNFDDEIILRNKYKTGGSGILKRCKSGKKFKIKEILELMITESDNTATNILTEILGFDYINNTFKNDFGFSVTRFERKIMDLYLRKRGIENYTTAKEMGLFLEKLYKGEIVSKQASKEMIEILSRQKQNDRIPRFLPQNLSVAHKTGFLRKVCHDTGIVFTPNGDFIVCILTSDFKSTRLAKNFIGEIAYRTYRCY